MKEVFSTLQYIILFSGILRFTIPYYLHPIMLRWEMSFNNVSSIVNNDNATRWSYYRPLKPAPKLRIFFKGVEDGKRCESKIAVFFLVVILPSK